MVWWLIISSGEKCRPRSPASATTSIIDIESPPRSKKLSAGPMSGLPSTADQITRSRSWTSVMPGSVRGVQADRAAVRAEVDDRVVEHRLRQQLHPLDPVEQRGEH